MLGKSESNLILHLLYLSLSIIVVDIFLSISTFRISTLKVIPFVLWDIIIFICTTIHWRCIKLDSGCQA